MPYPCVGEDAVDEVRGGVDHAAGAAGGAEAAALAGESDQVVAAAGRAMDAAEAAFQETTVEKATEFADDEARQVSAVGIGCDAGQEGLQVGRQDVVEHGLLGLAAHAGAPRGWRIRLRPLHMSTVEGNRWRLRGAVIGAVTCWSSWG